MEGLIFRILRYYIQQVIPTFATGTGGFPFLLAC